MSLTVNGIEVAQRKLPPVGRPGDKYGGFKPCTTTLRKGQRKTPETRALESDMIYDRDVEIPMRDGTILRADVFRPAGHEQVPALLAWGPYGKSGAGLLNLDFMPARGGIPRSALSGYENFEGPDPAEWVTRGYAIVNIDARGAFDSQGDVRVLGVAEGRDGFDAIEYIATLEWCTGSIGTVGNSWLAMAQYAIAAQQPPHLKCIAPLEGQSDMLRENLCRGGIPAPAFFEAVCNLLSGNGSIEDLPTMMGQHPIWNAYWADKCADFNAIKVPAYVLASFSTGLHTEGSIRCYEELTTPKWLRIHETQEWYDLYQPDRIEELQRFFDRYLKNVDNSWEDTPRVKASLLGFNQQNIVDINMTQWPHPSTVYKSLYLAQGQLVESPTLVSEGVSVYQADYKAQQNGQDEEELYFPYTFTSRTYLLGASIASLYVSCPDHDDLDIYIQLGKADASGKLVRSYNIPQHSLDRVGMPRESVPSINTLQYLGPTGMIRASRRELESSPRNPHMPRLSFSKIEKVRVGEVVEVKIPIWPGGMVFESGEQLVLKIAGHPMVLAEFTMLWGSHQTSNKGKHNIHFGGRYPSVLEVPIVNL